MRHDHPADSPDRRSGRWERIALSVRRAAAATQARARPWPWPWPGGPRGAAGAVAGALLAGILIGVAAGPPAAGSPAAPRAVVVEKPPPGVGGGPAAGDLAALQAPPPPRDARPAASAAEPAATASPATTDAGASESPPPTPPPPPPPTTKAEATTGASKKADPPPVKHVTVVLLADKSYDEAFGRDSQAPYLARELPKRGALLRRYFATAHGSLPNYVALLSGQGPDADLAAGCLARTPFVAAGKAARDGQVRGSGCVFGSDVASLPAQLERKSLAWRGYVDGAVATVPPVPVPDAAPCGPPAPASDGTPAALDRNPFLFLAAVAGAADCTAKVTGLATLAADLTAKAEAAPAFTLIVPDACSAGRDGACPAGEPSGIARSDAWLREWIPRLLAAPAYADDGMVVVTFDQARVAGRLADSTSCCGLRLGVNQPESVDPQAPVPGGGRVGAIVLSPHVEGGRASDVPYDHFALLRTIEDAFELDHLGLADAKALKPFGEDIFGGG